MPLSLILLGRSSQPAWRFTQSASSRKNSSLAAVNCVCCVVKSIAEWKNSREKEKRREEGCACSCLCALCSLLFYSLCIYIYICVCVCVCVCVCSVGENERRKNSFALTPHCFWLAVPVCVITDTLSLSSGSAADLVAFPCQW